MNDARKTGTEAELVQFVAPLAGVARDVSGRRPASSEGGGEAPDSLPLSQETLTVSKRAVVTGKVRVSTTTQVHDEIAEVTLERSVVDVSRVPVGRIVEVAPGVRTEGEITIVPVVEERFVVVKQLYLREELHIRHRVEHEVSRQPVQVRRQTALIERLDANGQIVPDDPISQT